MSAAPTRQLRPDSLLKDDIIAALRQDREREADRWLREAVPLRCRTLGLEALARQDSPWRPQAWLEWLAAIADQQDPARLLRAAKELAARRRHMQRSPTA